MTLSAPIPYWGPYPQKLKTIGDHVKNKRLDLGLDRAAAAEAMGVTPNTITSRELNRHEIQLRYLAVIIRFLGYIPFKVGSSRRDQLRTYRIMRDIMKKDLGRKWGVEKDVLSNGTRE